ATYAVNSHVIDEELGKYLRNYHFRVTLSK
ncbi:hypothetical protein A2U01_0068426, partial [Trifolium medium]|nr:hypothetical protein [Trifolium medium]